MRHLVGLFFNLLLTLLFNKGNMRKGADLYLLTHNLFIAFKGIQKNVISLYHKVMSYKCACGCKHLND